MKSPDYAVLKLGPKESNQLAYPNHDRANDIFGMWMSGATEDEIALFIDLPIDEVKKDLMYVNTRLSVREIINHNNNRDRILLQRQNSESFRELMKSTLSTPAAAFLAAGLTPAGILKEYREATGMVQKAEPLLQINTQINNQPSSSGGQIQSAEDVIRRVLNQINSDDQQAQGSQEIIDAEVCDQDAVDSVGDEKDRTPEPE